MTSWQIMADHGTFCPMVPEIQQIPQKIPEIPGLPVSARGTPWHPVASRCQRCQALLTDKLIPGATTAEAKAREKLWRDLSGENQKLASN